MPTIYLHCSDIHANAHYLYTNFKDQSNKIKIHQG